MLLAGDIGGTKTDLAIFDPALGVIKPVAQARFRSADYLSLQELVQTFLAQAGLTVDYACFGVAGPVVNGQARLTNLDWVVEETILEQSLQLKAVRLLNDLVSIASAVPHLPPNYYHTLNAGQPVEHGAIAVVAPGTGLGEAFLTWDGSRYQAHPSEGGHALFAPMNQTQVDLAYYMWERFDPVSYERVCSGSGIPNLYNFFRDIKHAPESPELAQRLAEAAEPTRLILEAASHPSDPDKLCLATLNMFVSILGAEASNMALKVLSLSGVYLAGGIPKSIVPALSNGLFLEAFRHKGRFTNLLTQMPIHVISNRVELLGAASYGMEIFYS